MKHMIRLLSWTKRCAVVLVEVRRHGISRVALALATIQRLLTGAKAAELLKGNNMKKGKRMNGLLGYDVRRRYLLFVLIV